MEEKQDALTMALWVPVYRMRDRSSTATHRVRIVQVRRMDDSKG